jgi:hypothetical protein
MVVPFPMPGAQQRIYEGFVKDSTGGDIPFYCNIITAEMPKVPGMNLTDLMKSSAAKMPGNPQFTDFQVTGSDGKESKWQMTRQTQKDDFYYKDKDGKDSLRSMDAVGEIYFRDEAGAFVMIFWRAPASIEQNVGPAGLADLAKQTAGGVSVKPQ